MRALRPAGADAGRRGLLLAVLLLASGAAPAAAQVRGDSAAARVRADSAAAPVRAESAGAPIRADSAGAVRVSAAALRRRYRLPLPPDVEPLTWRVSPAMGANSPGAFGAEAGDVYAGVAYAARARYVEAVDGAVAAGFGLGDARLLAIEIGFISYSTMRSGFGRRAAMDVALHHRFGDYWAVAVGMEGAVRRGPSVARGRYLVVSRFTPLADRPDRPFSAILISAGLGDGRFQSESDYLADAGRVNPFGSIALRVLAPVSFIADWTGQDLYLATSVAPFPRFPLVLSAGLGDVTGSAGDGARVLVSVGVGGNWME